MTSTEGLSVLADTLRSQAIAVDASLNAIPDELRGPVAYFQVDIHPKLQAHSHHPGRLFAACGITDVAGSRMRVVDFDGKQVETKSIVASGSFDCAARLADLISAGSVDRKSRAALKQLTSLYAVRMASAKEMLGNRPPSQSWDAVLHPQPTPEGDNCTVASEETVAKWVTWIESLGGVARTDFLRHGGLLTYLPVRIDPASVREAITFNPLRSLRPAGKLTLRS